MKIDFREAKSIITKSNIPVVDFVINPYTGCNDPFLASILSNIDIIFTLVKVMKIEYD